MLFANVCEGLIRSCFEDFWEWRCFGLFGFSSGYIGVPPAGHAFQAEVGGGITFVTTGGNVRQLIKLPTVIFGFMNIS